MCDYCMPLEPYDASYLESKGIKHMSFQSHLRQLYPKHKRKGDAYTAPLEEPCFKVTPNCSGGHAPWPEGICTKCQPSAITLQRQPFRFVDHVEFASAMVVDSFISSWRSSGLQRFGYLLGRYEVYPEVPLGVKAVVETIYEPPQENFQDELQVCFGEESERELSDAAKLANLNILGMVYTDLFDKGEGNGKVLCKRHLNSYFLSSQECAFSAAMQLRHPNPCRYSKSGTYGSKFVTCVISGNQEGDIDIDAYQISNFGMAMVDADIIQPSVQPSRMLVSEASESRYIPEIFYKFKNEYGVTVRQNASPCFPVEYLIVNVTHGFPSQPNPLFVSSVPFPIENRTFEKAEIKSLQPLLECSNLPEALSNFHLLFYLKNSGIISMEELETTVTLATNHNNPSFDSSSALQGLLQSPGWLTLMTILQEQSSNNFRTSDVGGSGEEETWACRHCTFLNPASLSECDMCGLPQD
ncbi:nuclear protein localization protein 4 [Entomophthora muscae]|uniref:Nuclear protein localization protein 4 n=1 Tax=Entomophthora muscae TaxID=34485 RepID=A0ACC2TJR7_9FUNG|nr:nuclear protein localization protein 4 [Entomophthora muscae]